MVGSTKGTRSSTRKRKAPEPPKVTSKSSNKPAETSSSNEGLKKDASPAAASTNKKQTKNKHTSTPKLIFILSPAKTLDTTDKHSTTTTKTTTLGQQPILPWTRPTTCDVSKTNQLIRVLKPHSASSLSKLLGISANLSAVAHEYWSSMELYPEDEEVNEDESSSSSFFRPNKENKKNHPKPCIFAFQGAAYQGLDVESLLPNKKTLEYLQDTLRIVDPLYGWLRPMDVIQPYRLEMATKNVFKPQNTKLADYWKPAIVESIRRERSSDDEEVIIINVASDEYSAAVQHPQMIKVVFRHDGRVIAIHAKRARGLFVRYCAMHQVDSVEQLQSFDEEGYKYHPRFSSETTLVFDRLKNWK